jgi:hypothetical protein
MYILSKKDRNYYIGMCNRWINDDLTVEYIKETIRDLAWATSEIIPEANGCDIASQIDILIDDILEIDSISEIEKNQAILELIDEEDKKELQALAKRVVEQIEFDRKEYKREAKQRGYCQELSKNLCDDDTEYDDGLGGMDSISTPEKSESLLELVDIMSREELQALAERIVDQEAKKMGYRQSSKNLVTHDE